MFPALHVSHDPVCSCMQSCLLDCKRRSWRWLSMSRQSAAQPSQLSLTAQCQLCSNYAGQLCALTCSFQPRLLLHCLLKFATTPGSWHQTADGTLEESSPKLATLLLFSLSTRLSHTCCSPSRYPPQPYNRTRTDPYHNPSVHYQQDLLCLPG